MEYCRCYDRACYSCSSDDASELEMCYRSTAGHITYRPDIPLR
jgi:hypothetical protein